MANTNDVRAWHTQGLPVNVFPATPVAIAAKAYELVLHAPDTTNAQCQRWLGSAPTGPLMQAISPWLGDQSDIGGPVTLDIELCDSCFGSPNPARPDLEDALIAFHAAGQIGDTVARIRSVLQSAPGDRLDFAAWELISARALLEFVHGPVDQLTSLAQFCWNDSMSVAPELEQWFQRAGVQARELTADLVSVVRQHTGGWDGPRQIVTRSIYQPMVEGPVRNAAAAGDLRRRSETWLGPVLSIPAAVPVDDSGWFSLGPDTPDKDLGAIAQILEELSREGSLTQDSALAAGLALA